MQERKSFLVKEGSTITRIVIGCFLYALSVVIFIDPVQIIPGSVTGIGVVVKALTGFPIGMLSIIINVPLVVIGTIVLGKRLLIYTGLTVLLSSAMIDMLAFLHPFTENVLLASIFGGVVMGVGLGMILDAGGTTGGTTVVGRLVSKKYPHIPMGNILLVGDFAIIMIGSLLLKNWDLLLYSIIDLYVCVIVINKVMYGFKINSTTLVLSERSKDIGKVMIAKDRVKVIQVAENFLVVVGRKGDTSKIQQEAERVDEEAACMSFDADFSKGIVYSIGNVNGKVRNSYE